MHNSYIELPFATDHNAPPGVDNSDQYPHSLVRHFLMKYTKQGQRIFDPFLGFGTTAFVAEELDRIPYGIEANGERFEWSAGQLAHWQNIRHGDTADMNAYGFPKMDFCITSPPYMPRHHKWNPLYGGNPKHAGYDIYLARMGFIFSELAKLMKRNAFIAVQADNLYKKVYTPLVHDLHTEISKSFTPQAETIVKWTGERTGEHADYEHTHCLIFRKS